MKEKLNKSAGITLIALVITIIVLLILAGISISFVIGNNGIIVQAQKAVITNQEATAKEEVEMAWISCESEYYEAWSKDTSVKKEEYLTTDKLNKYLSIGTLENITKVGEDEYVLDYWSKEQNKNYQFTMKSGKISNGGLSNLVTVANYGDKIDYAVDLNNNGDTKDDWKIFYEDEKGVFIIASSYVLVDNNFFNSSLNRPSVEGNTVAENFLDGELEVSNIDARVVDIFQLEWAKKHPNDNSSVMKAVAKLLNTNLWSDLVTKEVKSAGGMAIGSPTLDMWVASWNAKGNINATAYPHVYFDLEEIGYTVGTNFIDGKVIGSGDFEGVPWNLSSDKCKDDGGDLFFPTCSEIYCLASPAWWDSIMKFDEKQGAFGSSWNTLNIRPVVYIPASVSGNKDENGIWKIQ